MRVAVQKAAPASAPAAKRGSPDQARVGPRDDPFEREADHVADQMVQASAAGTTGAAASPGASSPGTSSPGTSSAGASGRSAALGEQDRLHREEGDTHPLAGEASVHEVLRSPGEPLDEATRAYFEPRFGRDLSQVRIHVGGAAERSARELGTRAYAFGNDIVFGQSGRAASKNAGPWLLAHELTHVVQQSAVVSRGSGPDALHESGGPLIQRAGRSADPEPEPGVLALGLYSRANASPTIELADEARKATGLRPFLAFAIPGVKESFRIEGGGALASAMMVQEALEGGGPLNIQAIYLNTSEVDFLRAGPLSRKDAPGHSSKAGGHTAAEYRNIVVALAAGAHKVDIYLKHEGGLSIVRAQRQTTEGAPLPAFLEEYLPPSFFKSPREPPPGGKDGVLPPAGPAAPKSSSSRSLLRPPASAKSAPTKGAAAGRAAAIVMLVAQVAEMFGILQRDPIFARAFAQKQNKFFASLGVQGQEYATADGDFTVYLPDHRELRGILFREIASWKDFSKFFVEASAVGFDFQYAQWVFVLPKDEEGSDVIYSVDAVIEDLFSHLESTDGPRPMMWANRAALQLENLEFTRRTAGLKEALVGEWRGFFESNDVPLPVHVVFEAGTFFGLDATYDYESEGRRGEGDLENINVGVRSIEFVWRQGSQSGLGELRFVRGRLIGSWGHGESVLDGGSWEMAKK